MNTFNDIKELVSALKREEKLISQMFVFVVKANIFNKPRRIYTECLGE
jgi:hypothetical protein